MSFQGDVAGLGLGELLQGLARGGREGSLTLNGGGLCCTLGVAEGQIHLLPEPDEDPEIWRKRCERAWVKDPNHRIDSLRMGEIAYAARLENLFRLLDCSGVHFRFEPGPLPLGPETEPAATETKLDVQEDLREGARKKLEVSTPIHCPPMSVEFALLEYARQADEAQKYGDTSFLSADDVPRLLHNEPPSNDAAKFFAECDGMSTVLEIADRLGWPLRQCRAMVLELGSQSGLRLADSRELLALAEIELEAQQFARAASRLARWCRTAPPGPPIPGDVEILRADWDKGALAPVIGHMLSTDARTLLRRLEFGESEAQASLARWQEMRKVHKHDAIAELHVVRLELARGVAAGNRDLPWSDMLKLARNFQDGGSNQRASVMLRTAADCTPDSNGARLEMGVRMLSVGMLEEGTPWVVEASRAYIAQGYADKAVQPLRTLLSVDPQNRDAKALLGTARRRTQRGRSRRRNSLVAFATVAVITLLAVVRVRYEADFDKRLADVGDQIDRPEIALQVLEQNFGNDDSERVAALRKKLSDAIQSREEDQRNGWLDKFRASQQECALGDALVGLKRALELPVPPKTPHVKEPYPSTNDLYDSLGSRLNEDLLEAGKLAAADQEKAENRLASEIADLKSVVATREQDPVIKNFIQHLDGVAQVLHQRDESRAKARAEAANKDLRDRQQSEIEAARAHEQAGDLERAVDTWRELTAGEQGDLIRQAFADDIARVESHNNAWQAALEFARHGQHDEALKALKHGCPNPGEHALPWKLDTSPTGAHVRIGAELHVTPFTMQSAFNEKLHLEFELAGHETQTLDIEEPRDRIVYLSRLATRAWPNSHHVEAPPVSVGDDHIVCDRSGDLARVGADGKIAWSKHIDTFGGIARAPVFLPSHRGFLFVMTEDGDAWILNVNDGGLEGPWSVGSPPREGPIANEHGVRVRFTDGRLAEWTERVKPDTLEKNSTVALGNPPAIAGADAGLVVLRRTASLERTLVSPLTPWKLDVHDDHLSVQSTERDESFNVRVEGLWNYVAWEPPNSKIPKGRLWLADGAGLRAFEP